MFIYVKPSGYDGKELVTVGTYESLLAIVAQYKGIEVKCVAGVGEKLTPASYRHIEQSLKHHCGRQVNSFIKPVVWRLPFLESEENLWRDNEYGKVTKG
jgi:hypothetical protein